MKKRNLICAGAILIAVVVASISLAQRSPTEKIIEQMEKQGCAALDSGVRVCRYNYAVDGKSVEAISFQPAGDGPFPGALLIPGYQRTARDLVNFGIRMANAGFAAVAVSQPGFGNSQGPPDFVGPKTLAVLTAGYRKLQQEHYVDPNRMVIFGHSRGGMAASLLAVKLEDVKAAVLGAGIYDFQKFYDDAVLPGERENMRAETGMTKDAIYQRSSILMMEKLKCPVLILHGEKDQNVPVSQAIRLRDRLTQLHKDFEIKLFPDREHNLAPDEGTLTIDFFQRKLKDTTPVSTPAKEDAKPASAPQ
jgi:dipeptidyl aminopeptidase/acylaminoacyl peptidase